MSSTFSGFSEEDLKRIKSGDSSSNSEPELSTSNVKRIDKIGARPKRLTNQYKLPNLQKQDSEDNMENLFDKCKLSIKTPTTPNDFINNNNDEILDDINKHELQTIDLALSDDNETYHENEDTASSLEGSRKSSVVEVESRKSSTTVEDSRRKSSSITPDIVRCIDNYTEDEIAAHKAKLADMQLKQKIMEEQNKKRKEMLAKALADRTKQTTEEVVRLEKIKKELQVLDGQFSLDISVLRKKIDQACLSYADAEKHYLKVEKEFLQAKINLQKEKEKKELLTEHLCALITHNETRKAQKLETLMLELASDKKMDVNDVPVQPVADEDDKPVIVDGVDEKTGKMVEFTES